MSKSICLLVTLLIGASVVCAETVPEKDGEDKRTPAARYSDGEEPVLPQPLPAAYRDYQILPGTFSPNRDYALLYPKRSRIYNLNKFGLYLVTVRPFRVLSRLPLGHSNLCLNARCDYVCRWAANSSAVVMVAGSRWGAERVSAVSLSAGRVLHRAELTAPVRRFVRPDFLRSKAERYNEYYDFLFSDDYFAGGRYTEIAWDAGWVPDKLGRVHVDCVCTNNPKIPEPKDWKVHFTGLWDLKRRKFVEQQFTRSPAPPALTTRSSEPPLRSGR
jgi:hypothetical protein